MFEKYFKKSEKPEDCGTGSRFGWALDWYSFITEKYKREVLLYTANSLRKDGALSTGIFVGLVICICSCRSLWLYFSIVLHICSITIIWHQPNNQNKSHPASSQKSVEGQIRCFFNWFIILVSFFMRQKPTPTPFSTLRTIPTFRWRTHTSTTVKPLLERSFPQSFFKIFRSIETSC